MTLNRTVFLLFILVLLSLIFLSYGPPQSGKWVYMWQAYVWPKPTGGGSLEYPEGYEGKWHRWSSEGVYTGFRTETNEFTYSYDKSGNLVRIYQFFAQASKMRRPPPGQIVYLPAEGIDHRTEFGIE